MYLHFGNPKRGCKDKTSILSTAMALKYKVKNLLRVATGGDNVSQDRQQRDWSAVGRTHGLRIKYLPERQEKQVLKNVFFSCNNYIRS